jgi:transcriptional/translational regulatory protein YebC/TACO1
MPRVLGVEGDGAVALGDVAHEVPVAGAEDVPVVGSDAEGIIRLMEVLEELDDVSKVFSNFDIDTAQLAEAEA